MPVFYWPGYKRQPATSPIYHQPIFLWPCCTSQSSPILLCYPFTTSLCHPSQIPLNVYPDGHCFGPFGSIAKIPKRISYYLQLLPLQMGSHWFGLSPYMQWHGGGEGVAFVLPEREPDNALQAYCSNWYLWCIEELSGLQKLMFIYYEQLDQV